ncbi:NAD-dependent epimerase/dehydratase family protein [Bacillus toyonensis]|uniref:NAD-dependent epimerase/dehydratase family protein n=1 Tax=Bacillus toyonensis TaxID=155322 RepID=UPI0018A15DC2|nr:NAD-dependent epimerase/dehydratase family protein [Bacillus toyonensis]MBF7149823.1 NAD-dependent epimerase/dehydratase family protein [Bacillus toyonensis]MEC2350190.1 NAD-dependent epimerase/dehydratase family protein [Bacillus toyonensis]MED3189168.1 NAD-dependent epimerase/dehydratase family protein [Bacillus toyonensis]
MKKILVTGGNGWIGKYVVTSLIQMGYEVHATYYSNKPSHISCNWHKINLLHNEEVKDLIYDIRPSHLIHLAWEAVPPQCYQSINNYYWLQSSISLIQHFSNSGGQRIVVAGTGAEYEWINGILSEDSMLLSYKTPYSLCKNTLRSWLQSYSEQTGLSMCWGRIFHLYGPYEMGNRLVSNIITSLLKNKEALCTHGKQSRDFLHVSDVADALVTLLNCNVTGTINIASGQSVQIKELASIIAKKIGKENLIKLGAIPFPKDEPLFVGVNVERLKNEVNWKPKYDLNTGIEESILWWKSFTKRHNDTHH